jgi:hypothetical protein
MQTPDGTTILFNAASNTHVLSPRPVFNKNWVFYSNTPAGLPGAAPTAHITFKLTCQA